MAALGSPLRTFRGLAREFRLAQGVSFRDAAAYRYLREAFRAHRKVVKHAETLSMYGVGLQKYHPINSYMGIYVDTLNIFIRVATILAGGGGMKK